MPEYKSESGKYRLVVTSSCSGWKSSGVVSRLDTGAVVATVDRNYAAF